MSNYWVVGASWDGHDDQSEIYIRRGYWWMIHDEVEQAFQIKRRDQIQPGDRIAMKRNVGPGSSNIIIIAIGIVKEIDEEDKKVYVNWLLTGLNREVPSRGIYNSISIPFTQNDDWVMIVFHI